jgi:hypothetical protein
MGKGAFSIIAIMLVSLMLFTIAQPSSSADNAETSLVETLVLEDQYRLVLTIDGWTRPISFSELSVIVVMPSSSSPQGAGTVHYLRLDKSLNLSLSPHIELSYEPSLDGGYASEGDRLVVQSTPIERLPQGQWQLYIVQESISRATMGIMWTIGNEPAQEYQLPYAHSSITDPLQYFGIEPNQANDLIFVVIFIGEFVMLVVIVSLISRSK